MSISATERVKNSPTLSAMKRGFSSYTSSSIHMEGKNMVRMGLGMSPLVKNPVTGVISKGHIGKLGRAFGIGLTVFSAYQGYKEGGAFGAVKGTVGGLAEGYAFGAGLKALGIGMKGTGTYGAAALVGTVAGATVGGLMRGVTPWGVNAGSAGWMAMLARPAVAEHTKKLAEVEMGRPILDQFGTIATMRQRSVQAIQNSKINGRSALGNEATYSYRSYFR